MDISSALQRATERLENDADTLRQAEIDRIYDLLVQERERWDGLS
jgi:deoxyhypusine synthase